MQDFTNTSISILEVAGKSYEPGAKMNLTDKQVKDPTVDWLIREGLIKKGEAETVAVAQPVYIPSSDEVAAGRVTQMTEPGVAPVAGKI